MPTKTVLKPGLDHQLQQLGVVGQVDGNLGAERHAQSCPARHAISAGSTSVLRFFLLPMKLSSTKKTLPRQPMAYRLVQLGDDLRGGLGARADGPAGR